MQHFQIAVVVGSLRKESYNHQLAAAITRLAPSNFSFKLLQIGDLPLYNQDADGHQGEPVIRLKQDIAASQGLLFVTPEYNRSIPGVLKNAIDHASRPYGDNAWAGKPAGVLGVSVGAMGTAMAQMSFSTQGINTANRVGVGVGGYRGQAALSVGYSRSISPRASLTFGAAVSGSESSGGVGVGFGW